MEATKLFQNRILPTPVIGTGKKIDWHDYKKLAEEKERTGTLAKVYTIYFA